MGEELPPFTRSLSLPSLQLGTVERPAGISRTWLCTEPGGDRRSGAAAPRPGQSPRVRGEAPGKGGGGASGAGPRAARAAGCGAAWREARRASAP